MTLLDDARERSFHPDVTVATIVPRDGRLLLVEERVRGTLVLNQPAGHLEAGESLLQAAVRETREETGWDVEISHLVGCYRWSAPDGTSFLRFAFAALPLRHHPEQPRDGGVERTLWLTPSEIATARARLRSPLVWSVVEDWLSGSRLPLSALRDVS
jgi:8-oxo-dGTP pyrophosphatase MutT (NUDIX family)